MRRTRSSLSHVMTLQVENGEVVSLDLAYQPMKSSKQGGIRATLFVFSMIFFDKVCIVANMRSMVLYLMVVIKFDVSGSATTTTNYLGTTFLVTIIGGFLSDIYMTRRNTLLLYGFLELLGYALLIVQSHYAKLQPEPCFSMGCCVVGLVLVALGKPFYRVRIPGESPLMRVMGVLAAAVKNWKSEDPQNSDQLLEICDRKLVRQTELIPHSEQFRQGCDCFVQLQTFSVQQGTLMDTRLGNFKVPAASIPVVPLIFMLVLIPAYEFTFVPVIRKLTGNPNGITLLQRVGVGLVLSAISMEVAGFVEAKRKHVLVHHNHVICLFWLSHYVIFGVADMFTLVSLMEFFYSEAPVGMWSLSTSFAWLSLSIGYFINSAVIELVNTVSRRSSKARLGWVEGRDMNSNHLERFYWFLAVLSMVNFANYLYWANWYKYKNHRIAKAVVVNGVDL